LGVAEQVESVGGVLHLASQPGQGTTMQVTIPLADNLSAAEAVTYS
jgi:signal transduction histidine kinase